MKFIHTADWHLGNTFHGHDRSEEHHHFLKHLLDLISTRRPDALIVAGDIFDTPNPSARAEAMLYDFLGTPFSPAWEWDNPKDRFGVAAEFKIGKNAMIGVSVERRTY